MKPVRIISMTFLALLLGGTASSVYAQEEKHPDQAQPAKQDEHAAKPEEHAAKPAKQEARPEERSEPGRQQQQAKAEKQPAKSNEPSKTAAKEQEQAKTQSQQRSSERVTVNKNVTVVNGERRIPDARFNTSFGREHTFSVNHVTVISGQPRFQYGGYWLGLGVPWPGGWGYADPTYIVFEDGQYYLYNVRHPGVRLEIVIL